MPTLCFGYKIAAFANTERNTGSDATCFEIIAVRDGKKIINGMKINITKESFYRDADINRIFECANAIQRLIIANNLLKKGSY